MYTVSCHVYTIMPCLQALLTCCVMFTVSCHVYKPYRHVMSCIQTSLMDMLSHVYKPSSHDMFPSLPASVVMYKRLPKNSMSCIQAFLTCCVMYTRLPKSNMSRIQAFPTFSVVYKSLNATSNMRHKNFRPFVRLFVLLCHAQAVLPLELTL